MSGRESTGEAKARMLESLRELPIVTTACKRAGIGKATYYRWLKEDFQFSVESREAHQVGIEFINDMSEAQIITLIKEKRMPAITLWLKHNHPRYDRGDSRREWKEREKRMGIVALVRQLEADDEPQD